MDTKVLVPLLCFFVAFFVPTFTSAGEEQEEKNSLCDLCSCGRKIVPHLIDCSGETLEYVPIRGLARLFKNEVTYDVDFSHNKISRLAPFPHLNVHTLKLSRGQIHRIDDGAFMNLTFLTVLDLSHNILPGAALTEKTFEGPYDSRDYKPLPLLDLDLSYNAIGKLDKTAFVHLIKLRSLNLEGNPLASLDKHAATAFSRLNNLVHLNLRGTSLKEIPDSFLWNFPSLEYLNLADNLLQVLPTEDLKHNNGLKELNVNGNYFTAFDENSFKELTSIKTLHACNLKRLTRVEKAAFTGLESLVTLHLMNNSALTFIHPDAFEHIAAENLTLKNLYLSHNRLEYLPQQLLPDFTNWGQLTALDIQGNPWQCDCHNEWMMTVLLKQIEERNPEMTDNIRCGGPGEGLKGRLMTKVYFHPSEIPCNPKDNYNPYKKNFGILPVSRNAKTVYDEENGAKHPSRLAVGIVLTCVLAILAAACFIFGLYLQRRNQQTRYRNLFSFDSHIDGGGVSATTESSVGAVPNFYNADDDGAQQQEDIVRRMGLQ